MSVTMASCPLLLLHWLPLPSYPPCSWLVLSTLEPWLVEGDVPWYGGWGRRAGPTGQVVEMLISLLGLSLVSFPGRSEGRKAGLDKKKEEPRPGLWEPMFCGAPDCGS